MTHFDFNRASMNEVIAEKMRRDALRAQGKPLSEPVFTVVRDTDTTPQPTIAPPKRPKMNKLEARYSLHLQARKLNGNDPLIHWEFAPVRLRLADGTFYKPDFLAICLHENHPGHVVQFHETKGFMREAARVRLNVASRLFWWADFYLVKWTDQRWHITQKPR